MINKTVLHFKGNEDFISRIDDYLEQVSVYRKVFTPFLTPLEQALLTHYVGKKALLTFDGGYPDSEHKRCMISYEQRDIPFPIVCLHATYEIRYHSLTHRDVLGALMNLGINRNQFGDIFVEDGSIYIFVNKDIQQFVKVELTRIHHCNVMFEEHKEPVEIEIKMSFTQHNIASFRLDAIVAAITHLSREKAKQLILDGKVKVDHFPLEDYAYICNNVSVLSIRGYGRFRLRDLQKQTRSNRFVIEIGKFK